MKPPPTLSMFLCALVTATASAQDREPAQHPPGQDAAKAQPLTVGTKVPALKLKDLDGKEFAFDQQSGKTVVVHFWSMKCPWEKVAEPKLNKLASDFAGKDFVMVAIDCNK